MLPLHNIAYCASFFFPYQFSNCISCPKFHTEMGYLLFPVVPVESTLVPCQALTLSPPPSAGADRHTGQEKEPLQAVPPKHSLLLYSSHSYHVCVCTALHVQACTVENISVQGKKIYTPLYVHFFPLTYEPLRTHTGKKVFLIN